MSRTCRDRTGLSPPVRVAAGPSRSPPGVGNRSPPNTSSHGVLSGDVRACERTRSTNRLPARSLNGSYVPSWQRTGAPYHIANAASQRIITAGLVPKAFNRRQCVHRWLAGASDLAHTHSAVDVIKAIRGADVSTRQEDEIALSGWGFLQPNRDRHRIQHVRQRTPTRSTITSVVEPWVDMMADTRAINGGSATRAGNSFEVNGRTYGVKSLHSGSRLYPVSGHGIHHIHQLTRNEVKALGIYNDLGISPSVELIIARMGLSIAEQYRVRTLWQIGRDIADGLDGN